MFVLNETNIPREKVLKERFNPSRLSERRWDLETACDEYYAIPDSLFNKIRECYIENRVE